MRGATRFLIVAAAVGVAATGALAAKKGKVVDRIFTHPEFAGFAVDRIAFVPAASYSNDATAEKTVEAALGEALRDAGYRWISSTSTRLMLRDRTSGDSLLNAIRAGLLEEPKIDSLQAPALCAQLRCDALLTVRVDRWEQRLIEWDQSGKPATTVQFAAALVDSSGALLWSAATAETVEGPYQQARANPIGITGGQLQRQPVTGQGGPPTYLEVVSPIFARWAPTFPAKTDSSSAP